MWALSSSFLLCAQVSHPEHVLGSDALSVPSVGRNWGVLEACRVADRGCDAGVHMFAGSQSAAALLSLPTVWVGAHSLPMHVLTPVDVSVFVTFIVHSLIGIFF